MKLVFPAWYRISRLRTSKAREVHLGDRLALAGVIEQMLEGAPCHEFTIEGNGEVIVDGKAVFEIACIGASSPIKPRKPKPVRIAKPRMPARNRASHRPAPFRAPKRPH